MRPVKKKYWVAKGAKDRVFAGVRVKELKVTRGSKLVGLRYTGVFDDLPAIRKGLRRMINSIPLPLRTH